jgi:hypothetical protein
MAHHQYRLIRLIIEHDSTGWLELAQSSAASYFGLFWIGTAAWRWTLGVPPGGIPANASLLIGGLQTLFGVAGWITLGGGYRPRIVGNLIALIFDWCVLQWLWSRTGPGIGPAVYFLLAFGRLLLLWLLRRRRGN